METQTVIVIVIMSVVLLFALPILQFLAFCLLIFIIVTVVMTLTHDGDLLLMLCEKWGADGCKFMPYGYDKLLFVLYLTIKRYV